MYEEADLGHVVCVYVGKYIYMANVFLEGDADNSTLATPVHVRYPCKLAS